MYFLFFIFYFLFDILGPICVETLEGKKAYLIEQENLSLAASPIRLELLNAYNLALSELTLKE